MKEISTVVEIAASTDHVWSILADLDQWATWNPVLKGTGTVEEGKKIAIEVAPPGQKAMAFHPTVTVADPGRELRWKGRLFLPGLFDGEHWFRLTPEGDTACKLEHGERFSGLLLFKLPEKEINMGFVAFNRSLKRIAEKTFSKPKAS